MSQKSQEAVTEPGVVTAVGAIVIRNGQILLLRKRGTNDWWMPGGKKEDGETDLRCLIRELREELGGGLGFAIEPQPFGIFTGIGFTQLRTISFYFVELGTDVFSLSSEHVEAGWFDWKACQKRTITKVSRKCLKALRQAGRF